MVGFPLSVLSEIPFVAGLRASCGGFWGGFVDGLVGGRGLSKTRRVVYILFDLI